jgi:hypothetical protein
VKHELRFMVARIFACRHHCRAGERAYDLIALRRQAGLLKLFGGARTLCRLRAGAIAAKRGALNKAPERRAQWICRKSKRALIRLMM